MASGTAESPQPVADAADTALRIGNAIRRHRETRGWSQFALAHRVNVDQSCISQLERGRRQNLNLALVAAIAIELGTRLTDLLGHNVLANEVDS